MPTIGTRGNAAARGYGFTGAAAGEELGGMVLVTPTSIASTGTGNSSSINANGSVTFSSCATLSLNGVFTADYDNYMIVLRGTNVEVGNWSNWARMRSSGTDATGSNYTIQDINAGGTTKNAARESTDYGHVGVFSDNLRSAATVFIFAPYLAQATAARTMSVYPDSGAAITEKAWTHSLATSYDGITIYPGWGKFTGLVSVYGLVGA